MNNENIKFCLDDKCKNCAYIKPKAFYQTPNSMLCIDRNYSGWIVFCEHGSMCNYLEKQTRERVENEHKTKLSKE
jgi:hypothetical protein